MAELDEPGDEFNFDLFGFFGLTFFSDDELLLTETDLTEQKETTEQTEIGQLNNEDIDNFITENRNRIEANCKIFFFCRGIKNLFFDGLGYITSGHFAHCSHFSSALRGSEKYYATRKISARIICIMLNHRIKVFI